MSSRITQAMSENKFRALEKENQQLKLKIEALQRSENEDVYQHRFMRMLFDEIPAYIYFKDRDRRYVRASNHFCKLLGCSPKDIIGKKDEDLFPEEIASATAADDKRVIETGMPLLNKEEGNASIGNGGHWVLTSKLPWRDRKGTVIGLFGVSKDITDYKSAEMLLRESEEKFKNLAEQSPNMIFVNQTGRVVYANRKCEEMLGYTIDEFYAPDFDFLTLIAPEHIPLIKNNFAKHMRGMEIAPYEYALVGKSGRRIEAIITTKLINYGGQIAILGIVTDITERKLAESKLREKDTKLEHQARHLQEMNVALKILLEQREKEKIDIRENLVESMQKLVYPYIEKLKNFRLDEESATYVKIIESNIKRITAPMATGLPVKYLGLTPSEVQVADLIRQGKSSKEIALMLHVSPKAVSFHRGNIRRKLGIRNRKINLYTYLQSTPDQSIA